VCVCVCVCVCVFVCVGARARARGRERLKGGTLDTMFFTQSISLLLEGPFILRTAFCVLQIGDDEKKKGSAHPSSEEELWEQENWSSTACVQNSGPDESRPDDRPMEGLHLIRHICWV
jgi:hypothetical protein